MLRVKLPDQLRPWAYMTQAQPSPGQVTFSLAHLVTCRLLLKQPLFKMTGGLSILSHTPLTILAVLVISL